MANFEYEKVNGITKNVCLETKFPKSKNVEKYYSISFLGDELEETPFARDYTNELLSMFKSIEKNRKEYESLIKDIFKGILNAKDKEDIDELRHKFLDSYYSVNVNDQPLRHGRRTQQELAREIIEHKSRFYRDINYTLDRFIKISIYRYYNLLTSGLGLKELLYIKGNILNGYNTMNYISRNKLDERLVDTLKYSFERHISTRISKYPGHLCWNCHKADALSCDKFNFFKKKIEDYDFIRDGYQKGHIEYNYEEDTEDIIIDEFIVRNCSNFEEMEDLPEKLKMKTRIRRIAS